MTRRIIITLAALASLVVGVLVASTGTATAATRTVTGKLVGTQLAGWTYEVFWSATDGNDYVGNQDGEGDPVVVAPNGSFSFTVAGLTGNPKVYVSFGASKGAVVAHGFGYKVPSSNEDSKPVTFTSGQTTLALTPQKFTSLSGQVYGKTKGAATGGLKGITLTAYGSPLAKHESADGGGRSYAESGSGGAFVFPLLYAADTTKFKVSANKYPTYINAFNGGKATYQAASPITAPAKNVRLPLTKGSVVKGKIVLPAGATSVDRKVTLWDAHGKFYARGYATTSGSYSVPGLAAGTYRLSFGRASNLALRGDYAGTTVSKLPPTFYKNVAETQGLGKATTFPVAGESTKTLGTQKPKASAGGSASGTITYKYGSTYRGPIAKNEDFASVFVIDPKNKRSSRSDEVSASGKWKVTGLAPGTYSVYTVAFFNNPKTFKQTTYKYKKIGTLTIVAGRNKAFGTTKY